MNQWDDEGNDEIDEPIGKSEENLFLKIYFSSYFIKYKGKLYH